MIRIVFKPGRSNRVQQDAESFLDGRYEIMPAEGGRYVLLTDDPAALDKIKARDDWQVLEAQR